MSKIPLLALFLFFVGACAPTPAPTPAYKRPIHRNIRTMYGRSFPLPAPRPLDEELFKAVSEGQVERVRKLLAKGANANAGYENDGNCLTALSGVDRARDLKIAQLLIEHGADVNQPNPSQGHTPLTYAVLGDSDPLPVVRFLLSKGANVNTPMDDGTTALHLAVNWGHPEVVKELLAHGANPNARITYEETQPVASFDRFEGDPWPSFPPAWKENDFFFTGLTPAFGLAKRWDPAIFEALRAAKADFHVKENNGWTVLHYAAWRNNLPALEAFLDMGLDPNAASPMGTRPIHAAVRSTLLGKSSEQVVRRLKAAGADLTAKGEWGEPPQELLRRLTDLRINYRLPKAPLTDDEKRRALAEADRVAQLLDPAAPPMVVRSPPVDARGTHYSETSFSNLEAKQAVYVEGDRAILDLTISYPERAVLDPKNPNVRLTFKELALNRYETFSPLPHSLDFQPGRSQTVTFTFPAAAAKIPYLSGSFSIARNGQAPGEMGMDYHSIPRFRHHSKGRIEVGNPISNRSLVVQAISTQYQGNPAKSLPKSEIIVRPNQYRPLPGLTQRPGLAVQYRFRLLPNQRWTERWVSF